MTKKFKVILEVDVERVAEIEEVEYLNLVKHIFQHYQYDSITSALTVTKFEVEEIK